jgi:hypothetical protein
MMALEVMTRLSPEERKLLMNFLLECLNQDWFLAEIKQAIQTSEEELRQSLDHLSRLRNLAQAAKKNADQTLNSYLLMAKSQGNA